MAQSKSHHAIGAMLVLLTMNAAMILLFIWLGWWGIIPSAVLGIWLGIRQYNANKEEEFDVMLAAMGVSKH